MSDKTVGGLLFKYNNHLQSVRSEIYQTRKVLWRLEEEERCVNDFVQRLEVVNKSQAESEKKHDQSES